MIKPKRIQRKRTKGWRMPEGALYVGRPTIFGNPFSADIYGTEGATDRFRRWLAGEMSSLEMSQLSREDRWAMPGGASLVTLRSWMREDMPKLQGHDLACWCPLGQPCHADVLLEIANA